MNKFDRFPCGNLSFTRKGRPGCETGEIGTNSLAANKSAIEMGGRVLGQGTEAEGVKSRDWSTAELSGAMQYGEAASNKHCNIRSETYTYYSMHAKLYALSRKKTHQTKRRRRARTRTPHASMVESLPKSPTWVVVRFEELITRSSLMESDMNNACFRDPICSGLRSWRVCLCLPSLASSHPTSKWQLTTSCVELLIRLKHAEDGGNDTHEAGCTGDLDCSCRAGAAGGGPRAGAGAVTVAAVGARGKGASATGLLLATRAGVGTLDDVVGAREGLEVVAGVRDVVRRLHVESTTDVHELGELDVREVAVEVKGTADGLEVREAADVVEVGVVGKLETTADSLELRHGHVGEVLVADEREGAANSGEVGRTHAAEEVAVETERAVERGERWDADRRDVAEGHVESPLKVGELSSNVAAVGLNVEGGRNVTELHADHLKVVVVGDHDAVDSLKVDAIQRVELGVLDGKSLGLLHSGGERQTLERRKSLPVDGVDRGQPREVEGGKDGQVVEHEALANGLEAVRRELGHLGHVGGSQAASDLSDTVNGDVVGGAGSDSDRTRERLARCERGRVTGVLDSGGCGAA